MAHISDDQLAERIIKAEKKVKVGAQYVHYKHSNQSYTVIALGLLEGTEEPCVVYRRNDEPKLTWVRSVNDWLSSVETEDGSRVPRFSKIKDKETLL